MNLHDQIKANLAKLGLLPRHVSFDVAIRLSAMLDAGAAYEVIELTGGIDHDHE